MKAARKVDEESPLNYNVFFYGTLRKGEVHHRVLNRLSHSFCCNDTIRGDVFPTSMGYPCLVEGFSLVSGEVYAVDQAALVALDYFEGVPVLYERRKTVTGSGLSVWVYYGTGAQQGICVEQ